MSNKSNEKHRKYTKNKKIDKSFPKEKKETYGNKRAKTKDLSNKEYKGKEFSPRKLAKPQKSFDKTKALPYRKQKTYRKNINAPKKGKNLPRSIALSIIGEVTEKGAYSDIALNRALLRANLSQRDKRLVTQLVYGTIENLGKIDYQLSSYIEDKKNMPPEVWNILRLSAYQLLFLDKIPERAIVYEGVELSKNRNQHQYSGLINGVLRNMVRQKDNIKWPEEKTDSRKYLSIMGSVPMWLVDMLIEDYGYEEAKEFLTYKKTYKGIPLRPNLLKSSKERLIQIAKEKEWETSEGLLPFVLWVKNIENIGLDENYKKGEFSIQGEASILAAMAVEVAPGMKVLDACAAPGGKAAYMAESMKGTGRVYAWDIHHHRVDLLLAQKKRLSLDNLRPMIRDAGELREDLIESFDRIILDVPCSGTGVLFEKPDNKMRLEAEDIPKLIESQKRIMKVCAQYLKPGGIMVYSTCSVLKSENAEQIKWFLQEHINYEVEEFPQEIISKIGKKPEGFGLQLLPHKDEVEGFFISRLRREK